ncbi:MAG: cation:proton antiporter [Chloroflexi bacterium]|nr:cation:proton antiporter [Chloroflexota bacterium]
MQETHLLLTLALITGAALLGGLVAQRLRQPVLLGYLVAGVLVGPYGLGVAREAEQVRALATMGVAFLMFALGVELSLGALLRTVPVPLITGALQITATIVLWSIVAGALGWPSLDGLLFGYLMALSSTAIVLKLLLDRGEADSVHGGILVGIMVLQDFTLIPIMVVLSSLPADLAALQLGQVAVTAGAALAKALGIVAAMVLLGLRVVPWLLRHVALLRSRELFIITIFALVVGTASASVLLGLSIALGAFVAGIVLSESEYSHQALADVVPLRDIFASFFFVSIGMLTDPRFILSNLGLLALVLAVLLVAKCAVPALALLALRYPLRPALAVGAGMISVGEFSFVLVGAAVADGRASEQLLSLTLATALVTIFLAPQSFAAADGLHRLLARRGLRRLRLGGALEEESPAPAEPHAVICGFGVTGRSIAAILQRRGFPFLVVDLDPGAIEQAHARSVPSVYGDASSLSVLARCGLAQARVLIVAISDPLATDIAVRNALALNPRLDVVVRVFRRTDSVALRSLGSIELVEPGFEAGLEMLRHTLHRFGLSSPEIQLLVSSLRQGDTAL